MDLGMMLYQWDGKHPVRNKRIVLCCDDECGDINGIQNMASACPIIIVGTAPVAAVGCGVTIIEVANAGDTVHSSEVPFTWAEPCFSVQPGFKSDKEVSMVKPIPPFLQCRH